MGVKTNSLGFFCCGVMLVCATPVQATGRQATPMDAVRVIGIDQLAVSPDGHTALYRTSALNAKGDHRQRRLWALNLAGPEKPAPFSTDDSDSDPAWSPDGSKIAFQREVKGVTQVFVRGTKGGKACPVTSVVSGVDEFLWSPDGKRLAITSAGVAPGYSIVPLPSGVRIFTRADYRMGNEYTEPSRIEQISVVDLPSQCAPAKARLLTHGAISANLAFWSKDSSKIYFTTDDTPEPYYGGATSSLRNVDVVSGEESLVRKLDVPGTKDSLGSAPQFVPSPNGLRVAFSLGAPEAPSGFQQDDVFVMDLQSGAVENLTASYDRAVGYGLTWRDNDHLVAINSDQGNASLVEIDVRSKNVEDLWPGQHVVDSFALATHGKSIIAVASDFVTPPELYVIRDGATVKLSAINEPLRRELDLTAPEAVSFTGPGGQTIHGFLHKPPVFDPSKRYPLITLAHGGPYSAWTSRYDGYIQAIAAAGYLVFYANPRGSASYGQEFASALADRWPGPEYDDLMAGIDALLARPYVDGRKLGISGASAGGILTDWAITHTTRFAAAVSVSDIADFSAYWFVGDQPDLERNPNAAEPPWLNPKDRALSPITYGMNVETPTLFISGDQDFRTPASAGGEMMFRLLQYLRVPTALVQFEGAGHAIAHSTDPRHPALRTQYLIHWMDKYLKGKSPPEFDMLPAIGFQNSGTDGATAGAGSARAASLPTK